MALNNRNNLVVAAVVLLLAAVAAVAWIHNSNDRPLAAPAALTDVSVQGQYAPATNASAPSQSDASEYAAAPPAVSSGDGYYPLNPRPAYLRQPEPQQATVIDEQYVAEPDNNGAPREVRRPAPRTYREYHRERSKKHSVEIVAGTAAAGAAIGAIAGGGKGAALGGLSGAGAGFVYDRLTHNH